MFYDLTSIESTPMTNSTFQWNNISKHEMRTRISQANGERGNALKPAVFSGQVEIAILDTYTPSAFV